MKKYKNILTVLFILILVLTLAACSDGDSRVTWPSDDLWAKYGLSGLSSPGGTLQLTFTANDYFVVQWSGSSQAIYDSFKATLQSMVAAVDPGYTQSENNSNPDYIVYNLGYTYNAQSCSLILHYTINDYDGGGGARAAGAMFLEGGY